MSSYEGQCGSCREFEFEGANQKGYCTWYGCYYWPTESCETHYKSRNYVGSPCYITTILCHILEKGDHCDSLNTLRNLRDSVMQQDEKYKELLFEYDVVGPRIAEAMYEEYRGTNDKKLYQQMYTSFIEPTVELMKQGQYEQAVSRYKFMTDALKEYYCISIDEKTPDDYDYQNGGHGKN